MEYIKIVQKKISKESQCTDGEDLYLLDAQSAWLSQQMLLEDCSPIVENYMLSTPLRQMILKIEPCQMVGISTLKSFVTAESVESIKQLSTIVPAEEHDVVYYMSCQNTWESDSNFSSHYSFIVDDNTLLNVIKNVEVKFEPCDVVKGTIDQPLTGIKQKGLIKGKSGITQEDFLNVKTDIFCNKLSYLLTDETEKPCLRDESNDLNERQCYVDKDSAKRNSTCKVFSVEKNHECNICGRKFTKKSNLKTHLVLHTGLKKYECEECGKKFSQNIGLKRHMVTHSGVKDYECEQCGKKFPYSSGLKHHVLTHTGVKDYECDQCGKKFYHSHHLKQHMVTHTGVKAYECEQCGKRFSHRCSLKNHMVTHNGQRL